MSDINNLRNAYIRHAKASKQEVAATLKAVKVAKDINILESKTLSDFLDMLDSADDEKRKHLFDLSKELFKRYSNTQVELDKLTSLPEFDHVCKFIEHMESMFILINLPRDVATSVLQGKSVRISDRVYSLHNDSYIISKKVADVVSENTQNEELKE